MKKNTTGILAIGALTGFLIGIFTLGFGDALREIAANRYFAYKMYTLIIVSFWGPLYKLVSLTVFTALFFLVATRVLEKLFLKLENRSKVKNGLRIMAGCLLFVPTAWLVNHYWLAYTKFHPVSLAVDLGLALFFVFSIWGLGKIFGKGRWESMLLWVNGKKAVKRVAAGLVILLLLLNAGVYLMGVMGKPAAGGPNIVYIVIDTLRYDSLGCSGYHRDTSPNIDTLAGEGIVFKNAYSSAPWTKPSVASLFSGLSPNRHRAVGTRAVLPEAAPVMAKILRNAGYRTLFFSGKNNFIGKRFNFHRGFDYYVNHYLDARNLTDRALTVMKGERGKRFFAYIHYMDVHLPYNRNPFNYRFTPRQEGSPFVPGVSRHKFVKRKTAANKLSAEDKAYIKALYDGQVRYVDENVKRIVKWLKGNDLFDNTLVVVTSDHGEEFWEHGNFEHGHTLYDELIHVPLIAAGNKLKKAEVDRPVRLIDLLPTVLKMAGIKSGHYRLEGIDLFDKSNAKKPVPPVFVMNTLYGPEKYGLIRGGRKLIVNTTEMPKGKGKIIGFSYKGPIEFYDLSGDPRETENLAGEDNRREKLAGLKRKLKEFIGKASRFKGKRVTLDKKTKDQLKTLGYL